MRSAESGVKNSTRLKSGWMIFDGVGSWCHPKRQVRHSSRWRDDRAPWRGSLHSGANSVNVLETTFQRCLFPGTGFHI